MFKIFWVDLAKATGRPELGKRPCVSVGISATNPNEVKVLKITSRNRDDRYHVRMNHFLVSGFCACDETYTIDRSYIQGKKAYVRDCTLTEYQQIQKKLRIFESLKQKREAV